MAPSVSPWCPYVRPRTCTAWAWQPVHRGCRAAQQHAGTLKDQGKARYMEWQAPHSPSSHAMPAAHLALSCRAGQQPPPTAYNQPPCPHLQLGAAILQQPVVGHELAESHLQGHLHRSGAVIGVEHAVCPARAHAAQQLTGQLREHGQRGREVSGGSRQDSQQCATR